MKDMFEPKAPGRDADVPFRDISCPGCGHRTLVPGQWRPYKSDHRDWVRSWYFGATCPNCKGYPFSMLVQLPHDPANPRFRVSDP